MGTWLDLAPPDKQVRGIFWAVLTVPNGSQGFSVGLMSCEPPGADVFCRFVLRRSTQYSGLAPTATLESCRHSDSRLAGKKWERDEREECGGVRIIPGVPFVLQLTIGEEGFTVAVDSAVLTT